MDSFHAIPKPGMGATISYGSDSYPYTIHKVDGKKLWASEDDATMKSGKDIYSGQDYDYSNNNQNNPDVWSLFTLRKDSRWHQGTTMNGKVLYIGTRRKYYDPSF